jgi:flagellum-specific peptidoglycan hydrolase FlgJ
MKKLITIIILLWCSSVSAQTPSHKEVYQEIKWSQIKYPDIALAQAILESGHFKSKIAKSNNNFFGMRMPTKRETMAFGKKYGYAIYHSWRHSVQDYKLWQDQLFTRHPNMTREQYKKYINKLYSTSANYISKINTIINKNKIKYEEDHNDRDSIRYTSNDSLRVIGL